MRDPDRVSADGTVRAWKLLDPDPGVNPDWQAGIGAWLIDADPGVLDPIPAFHTWYVGVVHLRDVPGQSKPAFKRYPEAEHELLVFTIDPSKDVTIDLYDARVRGETVAAEGILLVPADIQHQFDGVGDDGARRLLDSFIRAIVDGKWQLSRPPFLPDSAYFDERWTAILNQSVEHERSGHAPAWEERLAQLNSMFGEYPIREYPIDGEHRRLH